MRVRAFALFAASAFVGSGWLGCSAILGDFPTPVPNDSDDATAARGDAPAEGTTAGDTSVDSTRDAIDSPADGSGDADATDAPADAASEGPTDAPHCEAGLLDCNGSCLPSDTKNCGSCGHACAQNAVCNAGHCDCAIDGGTVCNGECVDESSDSNNCGGCGTTCTGGETCQASVCKCPAPTSLCAGTCVDESSDDSNCGSCGHTCTGGQHCANGTCQCSGTLTFCSGACVDTTNDNNDCGGCGTTCTGGTSCVSGKCVCPGTQTLCNAVCYDLTSDQHHCGSCTRDCLAGTCSSSVCKPTTLVTWNTGGTIPGALKADATSVYWSMPTGGSQGIVFKCDKVNGCNAPTTLASGLGTPEGIAIDSTNVYWAEYDANAIKKVPLGGGNPSTVTSASSPWDVACDGQGHLFFTSNGLGTANQVNTDGTGAIAFATSGSPYSIAVGGSYAFWSDFNAKLWRATVGSANSGASYAAATSPDAVAADGSYVFWHTSQDIDECAIGSCSQPTVLATSQQNVGFIGGIASDGSFAYWTADDGGHNTGYVRKCAVSGCNQTPTQVASYTGVAQHTYFRGVAVDSQYVYWDCWDNATGYVFRVAK